MDSYISFYIALNVIWQVNNRQIYIQAIIRALNANEDFEHLTDFFFRSRSSC